MSFKHLSTAIAFATAFAALSGIAGRADALNYSYETYSIPGVGADTDTYITGLNNNGQFVGTYVEHNNDSYYATDHGFEQSPNATVVNIQDPNAYTGNYGITGGGGFISGTAAGGINDNGAVAGTYYTPDRVGHGYVYTPTTGFTDIASPGGRDVQLNSINNAGVVTGAIYTQVSNQAYPSLFFANTSNVDSDIASVSTPESPMLTANTYGSAINNMNASVGYYTDPYIGDNDRSFIYASGGFQRLTPAVGGGFEALGLNDKGVIVGELTTALYAFDPTSIAHGFIDDNGALSYFDLPGATVTIPQAINNAGEVVGEYLDGSSPYFQGFVAEPLETITFTPGAFATGLPNGFPDGAPDGLPGGSTTVPEPSTWAMMVCGVAILGLALRRRAWLGVAARA